MVPTTYADLRMPAVGLTRSKTSRSGSSPRSNPPRKKCQANSLTIRKGGSPLQERDTRGHSQGRKHEWGLSKQCGLRKEFPPTPSRLTSRRRPRLLLSPTVIRFPSAEDHLKVKAEKGLRAGRSSGGWKMKEGGQGGENSTESPKSDLILTQGQGPIPEAPLRMLCPE